MPGSSSWSCCCVCDGSSFVVSPASSLCGLQTMTSATRKRKKKRSSASDQSSFNTRIIPLHQDCPSKDCFYSCKTRIQSFNLTKESLWMDDRSNPCLIQVELIRRRLHQLNRSADEEEEEEDGQDGGKNDDYHGEDNDEERWRMGMHFHNKTRGGWEQEVVGDCNHKSPQEISYQPHTLVAVLKACTKRKDLRTGSRIHADIVKMGLLKDNAFVGNTLVSMYAKCGALAKAQDLCDKLPSRNVVSWNALISGYCQHGHGNKVLQCFERMKLEGISPTAVTYVCALKACGTAGATDKGQEIHAEIARTGLLKQNVLVGNALVDMYAKCGFLDKAQEVFDELPVRDVVSWGALIAGYAQYGFGKQALTCFERMQLEGICPDAVTYACILKACGSIRAPDEGQKIHARINKEGLLEQDIVLGTALLDMYAKCGLLSKALDVFDKLPVQNLVSWSSLIAGYTLHGLAEQALNCFEQMVLKGLSPNAVTYASVLKACASIGASQKGKELHAEIAKEGLLEKDPVIGIALVDMYAKCGLLPKAQEVFDSLPVKNVVLWNTLLAGYALLGKTEDVSNSFDKMMGKGIKPDLATFTIVLNSCNHAGLLDMGEMHFKTMSSIYGITPALEHHTCMVDLLARAGHLDKALAVIKETPSPADVLVWQTLLSACQKWGNVKIGRLAFEHVVQLDSKSSAAYVCMSNIYADAGMQDDAEKVKALRVRKQALE